MCESSGGLQPNGQCSENEYCDGPNNLEHALCGKSLLCNDKGTHVFPRMFSNTYQEICVYIAHII